jgi:hypothetical protein
MNNTTLQIKFRQRLNKLASNDYDNIECWQIVESFNKAQIEWCRRQLHGTNPTRTSDEQTKRRIDDLQILLTTQPITGSIQSDYFLGTNFPNNYMEYKRVDTDATTECCGKDPRSMTVYLAEEANVDMIMRDPLKRPDFEWGETFCTMQNNTIRIYKREFDVINPRITFYRKPRYIEIEGCSDPYTNNISAADIESEFKDDIVEIIIDEACAIIAGDINDANNYIRGPQQAEKNN